MDDIQKENGSGVLLGLDKVAREAFELIGLTEGKKILMDIKQPRRRVDGIREKV